MYNFVKKVQKAGSVATILITVMLAATSTQAQSPGELPPVMIDFEHFGVTDGLSSPFVFDMTQDRQGFLWLGTANGVSKYDGYGFTNFLPNPADPDALPIGNASKVHIDRQNRLWVASFNGGAYRYDAQNNRFIQLLEDPVMSLFEDSQGRFWFLTFGKGLMMYDETQETFTHYRHEPDNPRSLSDENLFTMIEDHRGDLWMGGRQGTLNQFNPETGEFTHHHVFDAVITCLIEDRFHDIWISSMGGGLARYRRESGQFDMYTHDAQHPDGISHNNVTHLIEDRQGTIWVTTLGGGLDVYDRDRDRFVHYLHDSNNSASLSHNSIWSVFEDRSGVIWLGTHGGGLNKYDRKQERFQRMRHNPSDANSLSHNDVKAVYEDSGGLLWIGTLGGGLNSYDSATQTFVSYRYEAGTGKSLSHDDVWAIAEDRDRNIWVATANGLNRWNRASGDFTRYLHDPEDPDSLRENNIRSLLIDSRDAIWFGYQNQGVGMYDRERDTFILHQNVGVNLESLYEDRAGNIWCGSIVDGVHLYDRASGKWLNYQHDPVEPDSLASNFVTAIGEDSSGTIWIGTTSGLNRFDPQTQCFERFSMEHGLLDNGVAAILSDRSGHLWISTTSGISRFDPATQRFKNYELGIFNRMSALKREDGELLFGGVSGLLRFFPDQLTDNPHVPEIVLTSFKKFNKEADVDGPLSALTDLTLSYRDSVFSFDFAALDFSNPERNRYKYMLEGFDREWVEVGGERRFATYTNLDGGEYVFRVIGSNNDGVWNEEGVTLNITVTPPYWKTWWFRGLIAFVLIGGAFGGVALRFRTMEAHQRELERKVDERTSELAQANSTISALNEQLTGENMRMKTEMEVAQRIQTSLLPKDVLNAHPELEIAAVMLPADDVGGDYYDVTFDKAGALWFGIGDVSGHGVTPGLIMMMAQTVKTSLVGNFDMSPKDVVTMVNSVLFRNVHERLNSDHFMTFTSLKYFGEGHFQHAGAHLDLIVHRRANDTCEAIDTDGTWLNFIPDISHATQNAEFTLEVGDTLVLYTDGLTEAHKPGGEILDIQRFLEILQRHAVKSPTAMRDAILEDVLAWSEQHRLDDMTLLLARRVK